jgi:hypothetical protein
MQLHAACAALPACVAVAVAVAGAGASCFFGFRGSRVWRHADTEPHLCQRVRSQQRRRRSYFAAKNGARHMEAEPRAPSKSKSMQRRAARLCMDLYTHSTTLLSRSPSFVACSYPAPSRFPSKRGAALPSLLAPFFESLPLQTTKQQEELSLQKCPILPFRCLVLIRLPFKRTNNKQSSAFQSARSFPLVALFLFAPRCRSRRGRPADSPPLHLRSQWCSFSLCCSW